MLGERIHVLPAHGHHVYLRLRLVVQVGEGAWGGGGWREGGWREGGGWWVLEEGGGVVYMD